MTEQAVILAGGKGTRLLPLTLNVPKPMVDVAGHPFLYWQLRYLKDQGIRRVVLLLGHLSSVVEKYFTKYPVPGLKIEYSVEPSPLGTGGALRLSLPLLEERFWLLNGDSFLFIELNKMAQAHMKNNALATIAALKSDVLKVMGNLNLRGETVLEYRRDAGFEYVDAGVYLIEREIVAGGPTGTFDLGKYWIDKVGTHAINAFEVHERFFDIGTPERLKIFTEHVSDYF